VNETLAALRTGYPSRRIWAVFEPRSASSCRRIFQDDFAKAFGAADEVVIAGVFRSTLPEAERLSPDRLVADLVARGRRARYVPHVEDIIKTIVAEHRDGDVVILMSNGGFGGIHRKLLEALAA
jgi:UDP-N-acetylmuramate: L-alanyl-gamma-D-glutamyl-meso-diaminopimelate ligase